MSFAPTHEQQAAIDAFATGGNVAIHAAAGSGKTSSLRFIADAMPGRRGLYLAFNRSVADDARRRFAGTNVASSTVHALAYRDFGAPNRHRLDQKFLFWPQKAARLGAPNRFPVADTFLTKQTLVRLAEETVKQFCRVMDREITPELAVLPERVRLSDGEEHALRAVVTEMAQTYWADWMSPDGQIAWQHDTYLKRFALSQPQLDYDYLLVDEAQDLEPLTRGVLALQGAQMVAVGDPNQAIYSWRGAENALNDFGGQRVNLTTSFRFGDAIAEEANLWLDALGSDIRVQGLPGKDSSVWVSKREPEAVLTRSNGGAISEVLASQSKGLTVGVAGERKVKELTSLAQAALDLQEKGRTSHRELDVFVSWRDVVNYVQDERGDTDLSALVKVVEEYTAETVLRALERTVPPARAQQVISTAHIAKGLEWFHVRIADDFHEPAVDKTTGERKPMEAEEARLAYVAVTRAMRHLDPGGLSFIHDGDITVAGAGVPAPESVAA